MVATTRERVIVHVDMDAFYAAIEARDNPQYRGLPMVVGAAPGGRGVVAAASYEARRYGIRSAMPVGEAFARCPHAIFLPVDMTKYRAVSTTLFEVLAPLPVTVLWGVGAQTQERLRSLGIHTVGDLQRTPTSVLRASLGFAAEPLARLSRGIDDRPVTASRETKSVGRETTFDHDTRDRGALDRALGELVEDVARTLRAEGLRGRTVTLKLRYSNFHTLTRNLTLPSPTHSGAVVFRAAMGLLDRLGSLPRSVRLVGVSVSGLTSADL